jgi:putative ABC transport system permease protein
MRALELVFKDLRHAARRLAAAPGFCLVVLATLGVGIGANLAIFGVVDRLLLRPLPYPDAQRVVMLWSTHAGQEERRGQVSYPDAHDWRDRSRSFEALAAFDDADLVLSGTGEPERVPAALVSRDFFRVLGVAPALGRSFDAREDEPGRNQVVLITDALWQRRFARDPGVVGRTIVVSGAPHEVVGVLPASYEPPPSSVIEEPALYKPLGRAYEPARHSARHMRAIARLLPGVGVAEAQAEMDLVARGLERSFPDQNAGVGVRVAPLQEEVAHGSRRTLVLLLAAVGLVLLLACANVAHMVLARSLVRRREMAIRRALGASGARLAGLVLAEAVLIALLGSALGLALAVWATGALESLGALVLPDLARISLDWRLAAFAVAAAVVTAGLVGLPQVLQARAAEPAEALGEGARTVGGAHAGRFNRLLIVGEVAAAFVLLTAAGLAVRSLERLHAVDPGFRPEGAVAVEMWLPGARYPEDAQHPRFFAALVDRVAGLPGVQSAGVVSNLALSGNFDRVGVEIEGRPAGPDKPDMERYVVSPGYFDAIGLRLLRGRLMTGRDTADTPGVAVVGESTARRIWPGADALGKRIRVSERWFEIVGVVGDVRHYGLDVPADLQLYLPQAQYPSQGMILVVRAGALAAVIPAVREEVRALDPDLAVFNVRTLDAVASRSAANRRFAALLLSAFASMAVFLALVGIYGVISHGVGQRSREIGVRMALGARQAQVMVAVLRQSLGAVAAGLALGILGALAAGRAMSSILYGVSRNDPATFALTAAAVAGVAALACYLPARRASRLDPLAALRSE